MASFDMIHYERPSSFCRRSLDTVNPAYAGRHWHDETNERRERTRWTCDYPRLCDFFADHAHLRRSGIRGCSTHVTLLLY